MAKRPRVEFINQDHLTDFWYIEENEVFFGQHEDEVLDHREKNSKRWHAVYSDEIEPGTERTVLPPFVILYLTEGEVMVFLENKEIQR